MPRPPPRRRHFWPRADFSGNDRGVSEVIGNVIMVVLAVSMLGAFGTLVLSSVSSDTPTPPAATFTLEPTVGDAFVLVRHVSGSYLELAGTHIILQSNGTESMGALTLVDGTNADEWAPGETLRIDLASGTLRPTDRLFLMVIDDQTGKVIGTAWATVPSDVTGTTILLNGLSASLSFDRSPLTADGQSMVNASVVVTSDLGILLIDEVTLNLSRVGGDAAQALRDDGVAPDVVANDGEFTARFAVSNYTFSSLPGHSNESVTATVRDVLGKTASATSLLYVVSSPVSKVGYGTEFRNIGSSGIISQTGYINLTGFTFRDSTAVDQDQIEIRVSDLADATKAWSALVSFDDAPTCAGPAVTSIQLRRDGVAGSVTYTPTGGCFLVDVDSRLNLANVHASLDANLATSTWTPSGSEASYQYSAAGIGSSNEALVSYFGDITTTSPIATGLGQADLTWAPPSAAAGAPSAISTLAATPGNLFVDLVWTAPANGGSPITGYGIYRDGVLIDTIGTNTSYRAAGLTNGVEYDFVVRAINAVGSSGDSNLVSATPIALPTAPTSFTGEAVIARAYLNWSAPASDGGSPVTAYRIYLNGTLHATIGTNTSFIALGLEHNSTYSWEISAVTATGEGPKSVADQTTTPGIPNPPQPFTAESAISRAYLNWTTPLAGGTPITGYRIYLNGTLHATVGTNTSFVALGLQHNTTYHWEIAAVNGVGGSTHTPDTTAFTPGIPYPVLNLAAAPGNTIATLTWDAPNANGRPITGYKVYRDAVLLDTVTSLNYVATGLTNGVLYQFNVVAVNEVGDSSPAAASATPATLPSAPQTLTAQPTVARAYLNWSAPSDDGGSPITGYRIYLNGTLHATIGTNTTFVALNLEHNSTYSWQVAATNANGEGAKTTSTPATTPGVPYPPLTLTAPAGDASTSLTWGAPNANGRAITAYRIYVDGVLRDTIGTNTSYLVAGLTNGVAYTIGVRAVNEVGEGNAASASVTPVASSSVPGIPTSFSAVPTNATVYVNWSAPASDGGSAITSYRVYRNGTLLQQIGTNTTYVAAGLVNGVTYSFQVSAVNAIGEGTKTTAADAQPGAIPYPPTSLAATAGNRSAALTWGIPAVDGGRAITGFNIYNATGGGLVATTANGANTSFTVNGLVNGTLYSYRIKAVNSIGESAFSNTVAVTPLGAPYPPTGLLATVSNASLVLSWTLPINNGGSALTGFNIVNASSGATIATTSNGANTTFTINGLRNGFAYTHYVVARNAAGASSGSNTASATPLGAPYPPANFAVVVSTLTQANLSWSAPSENGGSAITGYQIYRNGTLLTTIGANTTYVDLNVKADVTYTYAVRAVNANSDVSGATPTLSRTIGGLQTAIECSGFAQSSGGTFDSTICASMTVADGVYADLAEGTGNPKLFAVTFTNNVAGITGTSHQLQVLGYQQTQAEPLHFQVWNQTAPAGWQTILTLPVSMTTAPGTQLTGAIYPQHHFGSNQLQIRIIDDNTLNGGGDSPLTHWFIDYVRLVST